MILQWSQMRRYLPGVLLLSCIVVYANSLYAGFVYDDTRTIQESLRLRYLLSQKVTEWLCGRWFADLTFAVNFAVGGLNAADYHLVNVVIHALSGMLVYGIVRRSMASDISNDTADWIAFYSALLWEIHPLTTAAVTYVSQRYESLASLFCLLQTYGVIRGTSKGRGWYIVSVAAFLLGIGCKETMFVSPIIVLAYDRIFLAHNWRAILRQRGWMYVAYGVILLLMLTVMKTVRNAGGGLGLEGQGLSFPYLLTQTQVIMHYLRLSFWPVGLCGDYMWPVVERFQEIWKGLLAVSFIGLGTIAALYRLPRIGFLGLCFFLLLAPSSSLIVRPDCAFDHRMYLPLVPIVVAVVLVVWRLASRRGVLRIAVVCGLIAAIALGFLTFERNRDYVSEERFWSDTIKKRPNNFRAYNGLATAFYDKGDYACALHTCSEALRRMPDLANLTRDDILKTEFLPGSNNLFRLAFEYGNIRNTMGLVAWAEGRTNAAIVHLSEVLRIAPGNLRAESNLAILEFENGQTSEGLCRIKRLQQIYPAEISLRQTIAEMYYSTGDRSNALHEFDLVLKSMPDNLHAQQRVAWILATAPEDNLRSTNRAVALAESVAEMTGYRSWRALDILAVAYAENGNFQLAIKTAQKALELASEENKSGVRARLLLYEKGQPFRESGEKTTCGDTR
jgi:protein O-mannosyl-transferase